MEEDINQMEKKEKKRRIFDVDTEYQSCKNRHREKVLKDWEQSQRNFREEDATQFNPKSEIIKYAQPTDKLLLPASQKGKALVQAINHQLFDIADRNQAIISQYAHFLVLLYCTIKEIDLVVSVPWRVKEVLKKILVLLQRGHVRKQLREKDYYDFLTMVLRKDKLDKKGLHEFMRRMLREQRSALLVAMPYYFNLFAVVVNKEIIFNQFDESALIVYSFQYDYSRRCNNFCRYDLLSEWQQIQQRSALEYNCPEI